MRIGKVGMQEFRCIMQGSYPTNNTNTESLPRYTTFDFKLRVPVSENFALNGSVENIFD